MTIGRLPIVIAEGSRGHRTLRLVSGAAVVVVVTAMPACLQGFQLNRLTDALIIVLAVIGLNLLTGFGGQISLGHSAFFGLGAYTTGIFVSKYEWNAALTFPIAIVLCFVVGLLVGLPALRLRGLYLALVTLTLAVIFPSVVRRFDSLTGGSDGLKSLGMDPPDVVYFFGREGEARFMYWTVIVCIAISMAVVLGVMKSSVGRAIVALRDNEIAGAVMGINRARFRTILFGISGAIAGLAGSLYALKVGIIVPDQFGILMSINFVIGMVLGGKGSFAGPVVGGLAVYYIPVWTSDVGNGAISGVFFGVAVIAITFVLPGGVTKGLSSLRRRVLVVEPRMPEPLAGADARTPVLVD
jgi:branched-chain amino acid transport system permease protein